MRCGQKIKIKIKTASKLPEARGEGWIDSLLQILEATNLADTLILDFHPPARSYISVASGRPVCAILLWHIQETNPERPCEELCGWGGSFSTGQVRAEIKGRSAQTCSCSRDSICGWVSENHWVFRTACVCIPSLPAGDEETKEARKSPTVGWQWVLSGFSSGQVSIPNPSQCCMEKCSVEKESDVVGGDRLVMSAMGRDRATKPQIRSSSYRCTERIYFVTFLYAISVILVQFLSIVLYLSSPLILKFDLTQRKNKLTEET